jgi:DNA primase
LISNAISPENLQIIKESVSPELLLITLGFEVTKHSGDELRAACRVHDGDNKTAFSFRTKSRRWRCFTRRCELGNSGEKDNDVISLVMKVKKVSFYEAVKFLSDLSGVPIEPPGSDLNPQYAENLRVSKDVRNFVRLADHIKSRQSVDALLSEEELMEYRLNQDDYFLKQGFQQETLNFFEIGAMVDSYGIRRATIPIRDHNGNLVSISGRREDGDDEPRYRIKGDTQKRKILYNLNNALLFDSQVLIVVEGFKASWATHEAGFSNCAACMGSEFLEEQIYLMVQVGIEKCILMFDGDNSGKHGMSSAKDRLSKVFDTRLAWLPDKVSPDDLSRKDLSLFINNYL